MSSGCSGVLFRGAGLYGGGPYGSAPAPAYIDDFVASEEGLRLAKSFMHLRPAVRRRIVDLVNEVAGQKVRAVAQADQDIRGTSNDAR